MIRENTQIRTFGESRHEKIETVKRVERGTGN